MQVRLTTSMFLIITSLIEEILKRTKLAFLTLLRKIRTGGTTESQSRNSTMSIEIDLHPSGYSLQCTMVTTPRQIKGT